MIDQPVISGQGVLMGFCNTVGDTNRFFVGDLSQETYYTEINIRNELTGTR